MKHHIMSSVWFVVCYVNIANFPDSKVYGANMGPTWGRQGPGGPHVGPMNFAISVISVDKKSTVSRATTTDKMENNGINQFI